MQEKKYADSEWCVCVCVCISRYKYILVLLKYKQDMENECKKKTSNDRDFKGSRMPMSFNKITNRCC